MPVAGGEATNLSRNPGASDGWARPQWSPDGTQLVVTGFTNGVSDLYIVNRDGTGLRRVVLPLKGETLQNSHSK